MDERTCRAFLERLEVQARNDDGHSADAVPDARFLCVGSDFGDVATALQRGWYEMAAARCIALAHSTMLLWAALQPRQKGQG